MSALSVRLQTQPLKDLLAKANAIGREADVALVGARAVANLVRAHLFNLEARSPRSHFYSAAAKSVQDAHTDGRGASFLINQVGLAQRWFGGDIHAGVGTSSATGRPTKYLAVGTDEVEGKTPWEVAQDQDMAFVPRGHGKAMLVQGMRTTATRGAHKGEEVFRPVPGGMVLFWLVTDVHQDPDASVMPTGEDMEYEAAQSMGNYLARLLQTN